MRTVLVSALTLITVCSVSSAAISKSFYLTGGATWPGTHGNLIFNGRDFVTPTADGNGALSLTLLNSNGVIVSNGSLSLTGSSPRVSMDATGYIVGFIETNGSSSAFKVARIVNSHVDNVSMVATNVAGSCIALSTANGSSLAVWQSNGSPAQIFARTLDGTGTPSGPAFPVLPITRAQQFPSVSTDGTNFLVAFMMQRSLSNDWQTIAQLIHDGAPLGPAVAVSVVNSLRAHPTATAFGSSNYLVAWSGDEVSGPMFTPWGYTNLIYPMVVGGLVSPAGEVLNTSYSIGRAGFTNESPAIAFGEGRFAATWNRATWADGSGMQLVQPIGAGPVEFPISCESMQVDAPPAIAFGQGRFCVLFHSGGNTRSLVLAPDEMVPAQLLNVRRAASGGINVDSSLVDWTMTEVSTNLVNWSPRVLWEIPFYSANRPQFFMRLVNYKWPCIDQLRAIEWAKQRWQLDYFRMSSYDTPMPSDLVGPGRYLLTAPACPAGGMYNLGTLSTKPTCSVASHTL